VKQSEEVQALELAPARRLINLEPSLIIVGRVQNEDGVIHVMADQITAMPALGLPAQASHDYH